MVDILQQMLEYISNNYALYLVVTMSIIVSFTICVLALIKKPIKLLTAKITNEPLRKLANKIFIFFAFGISFVAWYLLNMFLPQYFDLEAVQILLTGAFSIVVYALGDGVINKSQASQLVEEIVEIAEDTKKTKTEKVKEPKTKDQKPKEESAIKQYLNKVK